MPCDSLARRAVLALACLVAAGLAGCISGSPGGATDHGSPGGGSAAFAPDCALPGAVRPNGSACVSLLDITEGEDLEVSLAAHPEDPRTVLLTWTERPPFGSDARATHVWAAVTADGGATWATARLTPRADGPPGSYPYSFDSVAAFAPNGTALVLLGDRGHRVRAEADAADESARADTRDGITLAASSDGGATWRHHAVTAPEHRFSWDAMDLAVAPDTGRLYVTATSSDLRGVWLWRSDDGGASWTAPEAVHAPNPAYTVEDAVLEAVEDVAEPDGATEAGHYWPRVAAGPGGVVALTTKASSPDPSAAFVTVSVDGGDSWREARHLATDGGWSFIGQPAAVWAPPGGEAAVDVALGNATGVLLARSRDGGETWSDAAEVLRNPEGVFTRWTVAAHDAGGGLHVLHLQERYDPPFWSVGLLTVTPEGEAANVTLAGPAGELPWRGYPGDEYGGLAAAADGALWAAWSDPRGEGPARVAVARLAPT